MIVKTGIHQKTNNDMKAISFIGHHNSGKTTLIRMVARCLREKGIVPAIIKHTKHKLIELDKTDSDSWHFKQDNLYPHAIIGADGMSISFNMPMANTDSLPDILKKLAGALMPDCDLFILEGLKGCDEIKKIEVYRRGVSEGFLFRRLKNVVAIVSDDKDAIYPQISASVSIMVFSSDEIDKITDFVIRDTGLPYRI